MRVTWGILPRLSPSAPRYADPPAPSGSTLARGTYAAKRVAVQGPRRTVELSEREWDLLSLLFEYRGAYITRETILSRVWGPYYVSQVDLLDATLLSLRKAMRDAGYPAGMIREQRDLGIGVTGGSFEGVRVR